MFDFDGTLIDSNSIKYSAFLRFVQHEPRGVERIKRILGLGNQTRNEIWEAYYSGSSKDFSYDVNSMNRHLQEFSEYIDDAVVKAPEVSNARILLEELLNSAGHLTVLSSATPEINLIEILNKKGWDIYFDFVSGAPRTKTRALSHAMSFFSISPDHVYVIGDGADDMISAQNCGCHFLPVGEGRGVPVGRKIYNLFEIQAMIF